MTSAEVSAATGLTPEYLSALAGRHPTFPKPQKIGKLNFWPPEAPELIGEWRAANLKLPGRRFETLLSQAKWSKDRFYDHGNGLVTPCLELPHKPNDYGYVTLYAEGRQWNAHRYFFSKFFGEPPRRNENGQLLHLDHLCRNKPCCWIGHLELVTMEENLRRGIQPPTMEAFHNGRCLADLHDMTGDNVGIEAEGRRCRTCRRLNSRNTQIDDPTHQTHKLTAEQVLDIRRRIQAGEKKIEIARTYGLDRSTVRRISNREIWAHLD